MRNRSGDVYKPVVVHGHTRVPTQRPHAAACDYRRAIELEQVTSNPVGLPTLRTRQGVAHDGQPGAVSEAGLLPGPRASSANERNSHPLPIDIVIVP